MPNGTCIDLDLSGFEGENDTGSHSINWGLQPLFTRDPVGGPDYPVMITFSPSGRVNLVYRTTFGGFTSSPALGNIYFLIGRPDQVAPDNGTGVVAFLNDKDTNGQFDFFQPTLVTGKTNAQEEKALWVTINAQSGNVSTAPISAIDLASLPHRVGPIRRADDVIVFVLPKTLRRYSPRRRGAVVQNKHDRRPPRACSWVNKVTVANPKRTRCLGLASDGDVRGHVAETETEPHETTGRRVLVATTSGRDGKPMTRPTEECPSG